MAPVKPSPRYREWLADAIRASGHSKREVARRMAAKHPRGVTAETIDTYRRTLNKIIAGELTPTQPTRDAISAALGRFDAPVVGDDDMEDEDLEATLQALAREQAELGRRIARLGKSVKA